MAFVDKGYGWMMVAIGILVLLFVFHSWRTVLNIAQSAAAKAASAAAKAASAAAKADEKSRLTLYEKLEWRSAVRLCNSVADQTTFVAGNVFYQVHVVLRVCLALFAENLISFPVRSCSVR